MEAGPGDATKPDLPVSVHGCAFGTKPSRGKAESCDCNEECLTGFCADGLCCSSACNETCKACNLPSALGDCALVPAGVTPSRPNDCAVTAATTCGQDGTCDGKGGCRLYMSGTECKPGQCDGDRVANILVCDGVGNCSQVSSQICSPYACDPTTHRCASTCTFPSIGCTAGETCAAERCGRSASGAVCNSASDCASGFCVDGVCCNNPCSGPCERIVRSQTTGC